MSDLGVAEAYEHHVGRYGAQLAAGLMGVAGIRRGQRALDVGCGPGPLTAALAAALGVENVAAAIDEGRRVGYETPEELRALFARCGLADVSTGELAVEADYKSFDDLFQPFAAGVGHSGACFASLDGAGQAALAADAHRRLGSPEGSFTLTAHAWWTRGTVP